ncbi:MAG: helix-turn-helix domain-containing protein [Bacteroidota bacterium]
MEFSRELLFFFSALGAFNGLVIGIYFLLFAKPKIVSNYFLGVLLIALSIRIGKSVFLYFSPHLAGGFIQFGMSACLFIGPSLYFYLRSVTRPEKSCKDWKYHYLPLLIIIVTIDFLFPWYEYRRVWFYTFYSIYAVWLIYLISAGWQIRKSISKVLKKGKLSSMEVWVNSIFIGNLLIWIAYNTVSYTSYIVGALSFSFIFYLLILLLIFTRKKDPSFMSRQVKYGNRKIEEHEAKELYDQIHQLMLEEELYKNANLKLSDFAERLHVLPHRLSQLINDNLEKNFTSFVNEYRIDRAKQVITNDTHLKLESIGYECGFNSKSTFYSSFKKVTGMTPADFKKQSIEQ